MVDRLEMLGGERDSFWGLVFVLKTSPPEGLLGTGTDFLLPPQGILWEEIGSELLGFLFVPAAAARMVFLLWQWA